MLELSSTLQLRLVLLAGCWLLSPAVIAGKTVYQWKDASGNTHFTAEPPPPGTQSQTLNPAIGTGASDRAQRLDSARKAFAPPPPPDARAVASKEEQAKKTKACQDAQEVLRQLRERDRPRYLDDNGEVAYMTPEMKAERDADAQAKVEAYCPPP